MRLTLNERDTLIFREKMIKTRVNDICLKTLRK